MKAFGILLGSTALLWALAVQAAPPPSWEPLYTNPQVEAYLNPASVQEEGQAVYAKVKEVWLTPHPANRSITHTIRTHKLFCEYNSLVSIRYEEYGPKGLIKAHNTPHGPDNESVTIDDQDPHFALERALYHKVCDGRQLKPLVDPDLLSFKQPPVWGKYYADDLSVRYVDKANAKQTPNGLVFRVKSQPGPKNSFAPGITHYIETNLLNCQQRQLGILASDSYGPKGLVEHRVWGDAMGEINSRSPEEMTLYKMMCTP